MKTTITYILVFISCACSAQIVTTKEINTSLEREIAHIKELFRAELDAVKMAKELQAKEYERRLEILNGEAEQLRDMQATYVPRETFEAFQKQILGIMEGQGKQIIELQNWKSAIVAQIAIVGTIFMIGMALLNHFKPFAKKESQKPTT